MELHAKSFHQKCVSKLTLVASQEQIDSCRAFPVEGAWFGWVAYSLPPKTGSRLRRRFSGAYQFPDLPGSPWQQRFLPRAGQLTIHAAPRPVHLPCNTGKYERCAIQIHNSVENLCLEMYLYCSIELFKLHNSRQRKVDEVVMVEMHTGVF